jgi:hypothetical protein
MPIEFEYQTKSFAPSWPTLRNEFWESRFYGSINELTELVCEVYVDWGLVSTQTIDKDNIPLITGWIASNPIGNWPIWAYNPQSSPDMYDVYLITTKGKLQKKWFFITWRYTCSTLGAKATLRNLQLRSESLSPWAVPNQS